MRKLLRANMVRIRKTKIFWGGMVLLAGFNVWMFLDYYFQAKTYKLAMPEIFAESIFRAIVMVGILISVCSSLVTGTEYDDGTIRNKLMIGQARIHIYLADELSCLAASMVQAFAAVAAVLLTGFLLIGQPDMDARHFFKVCLVLIFVCVSYVSVFHMFSMLVTSKSHAAMINVLLAFALLIVSAMVEQYLYAPAFITDYITTENGVREVVRDIPNPNYLTGTKRAVYQFLHDFLPSGQNLQMSVFSVQKEMHTALLGLYAAVVTIGTNAVGMILFQRKDIK